MNLIEKESSRSSNSSSKVKMSVLEIIVMIQKQMHLK